MWLIYKQIWGAQTKNELSCMYKHRTSFALSPTHVYDHILKS